MIPMIKSLEIKNFESHEDTVIDFTDGLNLLIGQSNQGKSSIVRAIALVAANRFDKDCVRTGSEFCTVKLETDKGYVKCERGEGVNRWETFDLETKSLQNYKNLGTGVPSETLKILGMGERQRCDLFKEMPNIMFQLEKHYMLSEIDGKKASSSMIARMMDDAIGIGGMEELVKNISDDMTAAKKETSIKNTLISEKKTKLPDEKVFDDIKRLLDEIKQLENDLTELQGMLEEAGSLSSNLKNITSRLAVLDSSTAFTASILDKWEALSALDSKLSLLRRTLNISSQLEVINSENKQLDLVFKKADEFNKITEQLKITNEAQSLKKALNNLKDVFDMDEADRLVENAKCLISDCKTARNMLDEARNIYRKIAFLDKCSISIQKQLDDAENKFHDLKEILKQCPLCGQELKN